jgi:hypothetical protein
VTNWSMVLFLMAKIDTKKHVRSVRYHNHHSEKKKKKQKNNDHIES